MPKRSREQYKFKILYDLYMFSEPKGSVDGLSKYQSMKFCQLTGRIKEFERYIEELKEQGYIQETKMISRNQEITVYYLTEKGYDFMETAGKQLAEFLQIAKSFKHKKVPYLFD